MTKESQKKAICIQCRCIVEDARQGYAQPICFACLPPPAPLEPLRPGDVPSPGHIVAAMSGGAPLPEDGAIHGTITNGTAEPIAPRVVVQLRTAAAVGRSLIDDPPADPVAAVVARTIVERAAAVVARRYGVPVVRHAAVRTDGTYPDAPPDPEDFAAATGGTVGYTNGGRTGIPAPRSRQFLFIEGGKHPPIVTLCGSTRFRRAFEAATYRLTLEGWAVFSVACWMSEKGRDGDSTSEKLTPRQKAELDRLHLEKIAMSKAIHVLNPGGYIGESTAKEIGFAFALGLPITFLDEAEGDRWLTANAHAIGATMAKHLGAEPETPRR